MIKTLQKVGIEGNYLNIRIEANGKGEKERCTHFNAEFQRIARRDKTAFFRYQCKETEETKQWERLEISSRKLDTKGAFHSKISTIKYRNGMDLTEGPDIKNGKNAQKSYTKEIIMT